MGRTGHGRTGHRATKLNQIHLPLLNKGANRFKPQQVNIASRRVNCRCSAAMMNKDNG